MSVFPFPLEAEHELFPIEVDTVDFLRHLDSTSSKEIKSHLVAMGYEDSYINKTIFKSPLVVIDKRGGQYHYKYSFIGGHSEPQILDDDFNDRYLRFVRKLRDKTETDTTIEQKMRTEQSLLRQWLFEGKEQEKCAICRKKYCVNALDAAHKKERGKCNDAERLNPHIVMPLCKFGCHYLYDNKFIYIHDGEVCAGKQILSDGQEKEIVKGLLGNHIGEEWLLGDPEYFMKPE